MLKFSRIAASLAERQASLEVSCTFRSHILTKSLHTSPKLLRMAAPSSSEAQPNPAGPGTAASVFLVTSPNAAVSRKIAESILTKKLAACVNLVPKITSLYWWDGKVQEDSEELLIIKSSDEMTTALETEIKALHPYDTPEFIRLPITAGSKEYLDWIHRSAKPE